jgi:hypothetical protein
VNQEEETPQAEVVITLAPSKEVERFQRVISKYEEMVGLKRIPLADPFGGRLNVTYVPPSGDDLDKKVQRWIEEIVARNQRLPLPLRCNIDQTTINTIRSKYVAALTGALLTDLAFNLQEEWNNYALLIQLQIAQELGIPEQLEEVPFKADEVLKQSRKKLRKRKTLRDGYLEIKLLEGSGGDRRSKHHLSQEEVARLRARKKQLTDFWRWLLPKLAADDYEDDVWPTLLQRRAVQQQLTDYKISDFATLDIVVKESLKRRPYHLREITEPMPKPLSPAALAQRQACLEMGIDGEYETIRGQLGRKG